MSDTVRTFMAVNLDSNIQKAIVEAQNYLKKIDCDVKWVSIESIHLTLKFLGEVKLKEIGKLKEVLCNLFRNTKSIETELTQLGAFPNVNHIRVLWAGLKDPEQRIAKLASTLEEGLGRIGYKKERNSFSAHITIGRIRSPKNLNLMSKVLSQYSLPAGLKQTIRSIILFKSTLTSQCPLYEELQHFPLISNEE